MLVWAKARRRVLVWGYWHYYRAKFSASEHGRAWRELDREITHRRPVMGFAMRLARRLDGTVSFGRAEESAALITSAVAAARSRQEIEWVAGMLADDAFLRSRDGSRVRALVTERMDERNVAAMLERCR